jgi:hypothetical protein
LLFNLVSFDMVTKFLLEYFIKCSLLVLFFTNFHIFFIILLLFLVIFFILFLINELIVSLPAFVVQLLSKGSHLLLRCFLHLDFLSSGLVFFWGKLLVSSYVIKFILQFLWGVNLETLNWLIILMFRLMLFKSSTARGHLALLFVL